MQPQTPSAYESTEKLPLLSIRVKQLLIEIIIISIFGVFSSRDYHNFDPEFTLAGREAQWLTSSGLWAAQSIREYGYVPFWQPYILRGEPTIDSPFSFAISPINALPSLLIGYPNGVKVSVVLSVILAGLGGWYLARILRLGAPARVLLGLLMMVKGPMIMVIGAGYFQLGTTQAYIPWIVASALAIGRFPARRYPVVLFAISVTFQFWGGISISRCRH
jgi:hypothetical protein